MRISMMAGSKTLRSKGRIQMSETSHLQIVAQGRRTIQSGNAVDKRHGTRGRLVASDSNPGGQIQHALQTRVGDTVAAQPFQSECPASAL